MWNIPIFLVKKCSLFTSSDNPTPKQFRRYIIASKKKNASTLPEPKQLLKEAQQIYQIKEKILHKQEDLDRGGHWLWKGAQLLRHNTGAHFSKETLHRTNLPSFAYYFNCNSWERQSQRQ